MPKTHGEKIDEALVLIAAIDARLVHLVKAYEDISRSHGESRSLLEDCRRKYDMDLSHFKRDIEELRKTSNGKEKLKMVLVNNNNNIGNLTK